MSASTSRRSRMAFTRNRRLRRLIRTQMSNSCFRSVVDGNNGYEESCEDNEWNQRVSAAATFNDVAQNSAEVGRDHASATACTGNTGLMSVLSTLAKSSSPWTTPMIHAHIMLTATFETLVLTSRYQRKARRCIAKRQTCDDPIAL